MHLSPAQVIAQTPRLMGLAQLMTRVFQGEDLSETGKVLMDRAQQGDDDALLDLSILLQLQGFKETGVELQAQALKEQQLFHLHPLVKHSDIKLLAIFAQGDLMTNTPLEFLAQGAGFSMQILYVGTDLALPDNIPEHDIAIIAISELDRNLVSLRHAETIIPNLNTVLLNPPANIIPLSRDAISYKLQNIAGLNVPITDRISRSQLLSLSDDDALKATIIGNTKFPIIIRPIDSHAGTNLEKVENLQELHDYLAQCDSTMFFIAPFIDYRSDDGSYKKYRIMLIDGTPYIAHMAVSEHWMIHYLNADMLENSQRRNAEAQAMQNFEQGFAKKHQNAFKALAHSIGLDYFGIDCAESKDGSLLIFEACAALNVHAMDCEKLFPYKKPAMQKIFDGFHQMLIDKSNKS
jgi:glutathione synthase/RimK-type ligase-like ATP-grasp enzyme